jgi:hypothetical protein
MGESYKWRYAPSPYCDNAIQDTPRTWNEEIGVKDKDYWRTRKEEREGGSHAGKHEPSAYEQRVFPARRRVFKYGPPRKYPESGIYKKPKKSKGFRRKDRFAPAKSGFGRVKGKLRGYEFKRKEKPSRVKATYVVVSPAEKSAQERRIRTL